MLYTICPYSWELSVIQGCRGPIGDRLSILGRLCDFLHGLVWQVLRGPVRLYLSKAFTCFLSRCQST